MGVVATYHPSSLLLEWNVGKPNLTGGCISDIDGTLLICGDAGVLRRYSAEGSLINDMQKAGTLDIHDVSIAGDGNIFADTTERGFAIVYRYTWTGDLVSYHSRPGIPSKVGGVDCKIWIDDPYIFLPNYENTSPYRIRLAMYDYTTWYVKDDWLVTETGLVNSETSGLYVDSTRTYAYATFNNLGVAAKFLLHTAGGIWYCQRVWQYGVVGANTIVGPTGICVDELHGYVYVVSFGEPFSILVLDAATGAKLWTWDSFHVHGTPTVNSFNQNSEVLVDSLGDIYVVSLSGMVRKFKGFYDASTHEVVTITSPDAVKLWEFKFGPA